jgi:hypothetical protein
VRRVLNAGVSGDANGWADQIARLAIDYRFETLILSVPEDDPVGFIRRLGEDVAPVARQKVG